MNPPTYQELYELAYIPNQFACPKCGFVLTKSTLFVGDGAIGTTETDRQSEPCPNDGEWLLPATWKDAAKSNQEFAVKLLDEMDTIMPRCYFCGTRSANLTGVGEFDKQACSLCLPQVDHS